MSEQRTGILTSPIEVISSGNKFLEAMLPLREQLTNLNRAMGSADRDDLLQLNAVYSIPIYPCRDLLHEAYDAHDFRSIADGSREQAWTGDLRAWNELQYVAKHSFNFADKHKDRFRNNRIDEVTEMPEKLRVFGAALAIEAVFAYGTLKYEDGLYRPNTGSEEATVSRIAEICKLKPEELQDIIRIVAFTDGRWFSKDSSRGVLADALLNHGTIVRQSVSREDGSIDASLFGGDDVMRDTALIWLEQAISINSNMYGLLKAGFPGLIAGLEKQPDVHISVCSQLYERALKYSKAASENFSELILEPPATIYDIVPKEAFIVIVQQVIEELEHYRENIPGPGVGSVGEAALLGIQLVGRRDRIKTEVGAGITSLRTALGDIE